MTVDREIGSVALEANEFEFAGIYALRDIRVEKKKRVDVAAVTGEVNDLPAGDGVADGLIAGIYQRRFRCDFDTFTGSG